MPESAIRLAAHGACRALTEIAAELFPRAAGALPRRRVAAGGTLYREGDSTEHLFLVESGTLRTERVAPNGDLVLLSSHGEGDLVGELCFCEVRARQERAVAVDDAELLVLGVDQMIDLAARDRETLVAMMELLCHRVDVARRRLGELGFDSGERRIGLRILDIALAEGTLVERGVRAIVRRPSQAALASAAFVSREFANRVLGELRREGFLAFERSGPMTVYVDRLAAHLARES